MAISSGVEIMAVVSNLTEIIGETQARVPHHPAQRYFDGNRWVDRTYRELWDAIQGAARGLRALGVKPHDCVAVVSKTRPEWVIADYAILLLDAVSVPIYPSTPAEQMAYILNDAQVVLSIVENRALADKLPHGARVVLIDAPDDGVSLAALSRAGEVIRADKTREDLATLVYTSGTTGMPKGVMLTHGNLIANAEALRALMAGEPDMQITADDVALAFLPLSHILERTGHNVLLWQGATLGYARSIDDLADDLLAVRPTVMVAVPRVFEKIYARILGDVSRSLWVRRYVFARALAAGLHRYELLAVGQGVPEWFERRLRFFDRLVFAKVRAAVGGRLRYVIAGGAPLAPDIGRFFFAVGIPVLEGYGLTETAPVLAVNRPPVPRYGTVGKPLPGVSVRIAEDGEILARGPNIMAGYWNRPEDTQAAIVDGWFGTGDLGELTPDGFLRVTDRKRNIIVLSTGKNVAPQGVEQRLILSPLIEQAVVLGDRRKYVSALLYLDPHRVGEWAARHHKSGLDPRVLLKDPDLVAHTLAEVERTTQGLADFERPKRVALLPEPLSEAKGELTPSLKVKLAVVERRYQSMIDRLYGETRDASDLSLSAMRPKAAVGRTLAAIGAGVIVALIIHFVVG